MSLIWQSDFSSMPALKHDWCIQAADDSRVQLVDVTSIEGVGAIHAERFLRKAARLTTEPGDTKIAYSGDMNRCDLYKIKPGTLDPDVYNEGVSHWWAWSTLFEQNFIVPTGQSFVVQDFHNTGDAAAASFHVNFSNWNQPPPYGRLQFQLFSGSDPMHPHSYVSTIGDLVRGVWYDFVLHFHWSSKADGYADGWVNGVQLLKYRGPTLYPGQGVYFKAALYHAMNINNPSPIACAVVHDRIRMGTTQSSVTTA